MRWPKIGLFLLTLLLLAVIPLTAEALQVQICVPNCVPPLTGKTVVNKGPGVISTPSAGVTRTTVDISGTNIQLPGSGTDPTKRFTITSTAKVVSEQSATLQKITLSTTKITAPTAAVCTTASSNPCTIQIVATSEPADFPTAKPTGGYPAGVIMAGFFTGNQAASPNGDTISMTGEASGLSSATPPLPLGNDVINATPGAGSGDTAKSLPSSCSGSSTCKFTATNALKSFNTQITETVQQACTSPATSCGTRLKTTLDISLKTPGNSVTLPAGLVTVDPPDTADPSPINLTALLLAETAPPFENLDVRHLLVFSNSFALDARFTLDAENSINPAREEVYLRVGPFGMTIPAGKFKRSLGGRLFTFVGRVDGLDVAATFTRDSLSSPNWTFAIGVHGADLTGLPLPPAQVPVELAVDRDRGSDLVTAAIFP